MKSFLGNFYRHLVIFIWSHCSRVKFTAIITPRVVQTLVTNGSVFVEWHISWKIHFWSWTFLAKNIVHVQLALPSQSHLLAANFQILFLLTSNKCPYLVKPCLRPSQMRCNTLGMPIKTSTGLQLRVSSTLKFWPRYSSALLWTTLNGSLTIAVSSLVKVISRPQVDVVLVSCLLVHLVFLVFDDADVLDF